MIFKGVSQFFRNLKYYFVPTGTLFLGIVFGLSVFLPGIGSALFRLCEDVAQLIGETAVSNEQLLESLAARISELDWSNPLHAVASMFDGNWLEETLEGSVKPFIEDYDAYAAQLDAIIQTAADELSALAAVLLAWTAAGLFAGFIMLGRLVSLNMTGNSLFRFLLSVLVKSVLGVALIFACSLLASVGLLSGVLSVLAVFLLVSALSLFSAAIVIGKKTELKQVVNAKNIAALLVGDVCIFAVCAAMVAIVWAVTSPIAAFVLALPLLEICFFVLSENAGSYVTEQGKKG